MKRDWSGFAREMLAAAAVLTLFVLIAYTVIDPIGARANLCAAVGPVYECTNSGPQP